MKNIGVAVIDFEKELPGKLGKKGTASDYTIYNRKSEDSVMCFYEPSLYPEKLVSLLHCLNSADCAILVFDGISKELGEAIVALDALRMRGLVTFRSGSMAELAPLVKGTAVEKFEEVPYDAAAILAKLESFSPARDANAPVRIPLDSAFVVKSVGLVALGITKSGTVKVHDEFVVYPSGKKASVRSLQVQDKDVQSSDAGDRVGLCLKNVELGDLDRGVELAKEGELSGGSELSAEVEVSRFQKTGIADGASLFLSLGMQFVNAKASGSAEPGKKGALKLLLQKPAAYKKGDIGLIVDTNRPLRIVGRATF